MWIRRTFNLNFIMFGIFVLVTCIAQPPKILPRFWTNTGFSPIGNEIEKVFLSNDTLTNIELISSLPNNGLNSIRIHWILDLVNTEIPSNEQKFKDLDKFLDVLISSGLELGLELMSHNKNLDWNHDVYEILCRYSRRYGINVTSQWKLETWNEPDLKTYNVLNFTLNDYLKYMDDIQTGIERASNELKFDFKLRGPAGLFKSRETHEFCWKILENCEKRCPFNVITFHRKGNGTSESILSEGVSLIVELSNKFPKLSQMKFANDEADPIAIWSIPREMQASVGYAATLVETVLSHWTAMYQNLINLESISHDNAFLSFYPHQFTQRTLLARFQMNNSVPRHTQFIQKPVFAALGLLSNLGALGFDTQIKREWHGKKVTYLSTIGNGSYFYLSTIMVFRQSGTKFKEKNDKNFKFQIPLEIKCKLHKNSTIWFVVEGLIQHLNDPYYFWKLNGSPAYPNSSLRADLRKLQTPILLDHGKQNGSKHFFEIPNRYLRKSNTSVLLIRACDENIPRSHQVFNVRLRNITSNEVLLLWSDKNYSERCIMTYQIYFRPLKVKKWIDITRNLHVPFMNFQFHFKESIEGCFKIRSIDIMMRKSKFSLVTCI
uniref:CSON002247 protein n=1 Tax=Culicoides sonorensis TaxID=179676 RepID=A0A336ML52_CULSO